ncbi:MAG: hypothetical protein HUU35_14780, partial [Armatimonadetes bacterium]|nr:hypothetical protein [Armatimonadota bacterium]
GPLFSEDFDPPKHRWDVDGLRRIESGEIRIRAVAGYLLSGQALPLTDYTAAVRARAMSSGGGTYGLVTRLQRDAQSGYLFLLRDPDVFAVARLDAGKPILLRRGEVAVTAGWNQLEVDCLGGLFVFRVNGAVVASFSDDRYATGGVGLWVDNHRQAAFDDLLVTAAERPDTSGSGRELPLPEPDRKVLLEERFDPPQLAWLEDEQRRIVEGALELRSEEGRFAISGAPESRTGDYQVQVEATRLDGPDRGLHGLLVRLQPDSRSGYLLAVYGGGRYLVLRFDAEGYVALARGETPLRPGANTLAAACQGAELQFLVNGTVVTRLTDTTYPGGGFGLYADNGVVARFDNLLATTTVSQ